MAPLVSSSAPCAWQRATALTDQFDIQYYASYFFSKFPCINIDVEEKIKDRRVKTLNRKQPFVHRLKEQSASTTVVAAVGKIKIVKSKGT